jgi:glycosyltransferase involved in cell wall biosynthesis
VDLAINGIRLMGKRHGVGRYIEYLLRHWANMEHPFGQIRLYTPRELEEPIELPKFVEHKILQTSHSNAYWEQVILPRFHRQTDLLFCPSYVVPLAIRGRTVVTHLGSYEAIPSAFPWYERLKAKLIYQLSAKKADIVITVSESSKLDIIQHYGISPEKIKVIPLGVAPTFRPLHDSDIVQLTRKKYFGGDRPYILFVGKLAKRRNIPELMAAFARIKEKQRIPHGLLLIGQNSVGYNIPQLAKELGIEDSVIHQEFANHEELINIYNAAELFVYPSSYEGFGIPVLEAMACGVPAITLKNSAFLEFANGAAYLAKDGSVDELDRGIQKVLLSKELQTQMSQAGIHRAQHFGWKAIAEKTMGVLAEVAQRSA